MACKEIILKKKQLCFKRYLLKKLKYQHENIKKTNIKHSAGIRHSTCLAMAPTIIIMSRTAGKNGIWKCHQHFIICRDRVPCVECINNVILGIGMLAGDIHHSESYTDIFILFKTKFYYLYLLMVPF